MSDNLQRLVDAIPEVYQPIYRHPELSANASRACADRLSHITEVYDALAADFGRPLRVLDLGCAQGFFSLSLAARGAQVHGVDFLDENIAVCAELARENPQAAVNFESARIEELVASITSGQYDLVLGLSVFHHLVHKHGVEVVQSILARLVEHVTAMVLEFALREEPLYWGPSQPATPVDLIAGCAFVHQLARCSTHLSRIERPLYVASNKYLLFGAHAYKFDSWSFEPHSLARGTHQGSRRYYFAERFIAKHYCFDHPVRGAHNRAEAERERIFFSEPPAEFEVPQLFEIGSSEVEGWLVMGRIQGQLLLDVLGQGREGLDRRGVLRQTLEQLCALERAGLYHNDLRAWNVIIHEGGNIRLIDYGSIVSQSGDCVWPRNVFLAFFIFVHEVVTGQIDNPDPLRAIAISPYGLPEPYRSWAMRVWQEPPTSWSFALILQRFNERAEPVLATGAQELWAEAIESALQIQKQFVQSLRDRIESLRDALAASNLHLDGQYARLDSQLQGTNAHADEVTARAELLQQQAHEIALRATAAEALAQEREIELGRSASHAQQIVDMARYQMQVLVEQTASHIGQIEAERNALAQRNQEAAAEVVRAHTKELEVSTSHLASVQQQLADSHQAHAEAQTLLTDKLHTRMSELLALQESHHRLEKALAEMSADNQRHLHVAESRACEIAGLSSHVADIQQQLADSHQAHAEAQALLADKLHTRMSELLALQESHHRLEKALAEMSADNRLHLHVAESRACEIAGLSSHVADIQQQLVDSYQANAEAQAILGQKQAEIEYWHGRVLQLHASTSWQITKPMRYLKRLLSSESSTPTIRQASDPKKNSLLFCGRHALRTGIVHGIRFVFLRPKLRSGLSRLLKTFPGLHRRLLRLGVNAGAITYHGLAHLGRDGRIEATVSDEAQANNPTEPPPPPPEPASISATTNSVLLTNQPPRTHQIYHDLKAAIAHKRVNS